MQPDLPYDEQALLRQVATGNEAAFTQLFQHWYPRLLAFVLKVTQSRELSEEIVQDVFTKLWLRRTELEKVENFQSYLFAMTRNQSLNELQKIAVYWKMQKNFADQHKEYSESPLPEENVSAELMEAAVQQLSDRQREIWILHRREQYTYDEIAGKLNISKETVKTHLQAATKVITDYLKGREALLLLLMAASW